MVLIEKKLAGVTERGLARFLSNARKGVRLRGTVNILLTSNARMRTLNARFRGKNKSTDVLSFPAAQDDGFAGEIAISAEIAAQNAIHFGHAPLVEVKVLVLHGLLHLAGYDHERDNGAMARKEEKLRRALRLPVALTERAAGKRVRA